MKKFLTGLVTLVLVLLAFFGGMAFITIGTKVQEDEIECEIKRSEKIEQTKSQIKELEERIQDLEKGETFEDKSDRWITCSKEFLDELEFNNRKNVYFGQE